MFCFNLFIFHLAVFLTETKKISLAIKSGCSLLVLVCLWWGLRLLRVAGQMLRLVFITLKGYLFGLDIVAVLVEVV